MEDVLDGGAPVTGKNEKEQSACCSSLPSDVLLLVFEYLAVPDLLAARGVCRRWRDVALSRAAWRHRDLDYRTTFSMPAVLRLAPCLRRLKLKLTDLHMVPINHVNCAVAHVSVSTRRLIMLHSDPLLRIVHEWDVYKTLSVLESLLSAGLENLTLEYFEMDYRSLRLLLRAIRGSSLTGLNLIAGPCFSSNAAGSGPLTLRGQNEASLQYLKYSNGFLQLSGWGRKCWPPVVCAVEFLLQTHAPTLRRLSLTDLPSDFPASLLSPCVNLSELYCEGLEGMPALLHCAALESLHLVLNYIRLRNRPTILQDVREFFAGATGVRRLTFSSSHVADFPDPSATNALPRITFSEACMDLLRTLAGTRQSNLTSLSASNLRCPGTSGNYGGLGQLLPAFPQLTRVALTGIGRARDCWRELLPLLDAVSPAAAPRLTMLELGVTLCPDDHAQDTANHGRHLVEGLRSLVCRNPALHVTGPLVCVQCQKDECYRRLECGSCWVEGGVALGPMYGWSAYKPLFGLYSHDPDEPCDLHTGVKHWVKLEASG